jgi:hypothetical protein
MTVATETVTAMADHPQEPVPKTRFGKGKGRSPGKGKGKTKNRGDRNPNTDTCSYCDILGHNARDCRKRQAIRGEGYKRFTTKEKQGRMPKITSLVEIDDELHLQFKQHAVSVTMATPEEDQRKPMRLSPTH